MDDDDKAAVGNGPEDVAQRLRARLEEIGNGYREAIEEGQLRADAAAQMFTPVALGLVMGVELAGYSFRSGPHDMRPVIERLLQTLDHDWFSHLRTQPGIELFK